MSRPRAISPDNKKMGQTRLERVIFRSSDGRLPSLAIAPAMSFRQDHSKILTTTRSLNIVSSVEQNSLLRDE
jgi:hypothetical protein